MYIYWLGRRKTASRVTYSRRRYPENIYRPRRENKRSFWEPASYDDLSARFNGVSSVAVPTRWTSIRVSSMYFAFPRTRSLACAGLYGWIYGLSHSFSLHRSDSGAEALERYIDFYERAEAVKLLHQKDVRSLRVTLVKIGESRNQKPILDRSGPLMRHSHKSRLKKWFLIRILSWYQDASTKVYTRVGEFS